MRWAKFWQSRSNGQGQMPKIEKGSRVGHRPLAPFSAEEGSYFCRLPFEF
jgi:hypothetical protein